LNSSLAALKIVSCIFVFVAGCFFAEATSNYILWIGIGIGILITVLAIANIDTRDHGKEPVTDAEVKADMISTMISHLESSTHAEKECAPCPIPEMLKTLEK